MTTIWLSFAMKIIYCSAFPCPTFEMASSLQSFSYLLSLNVTLFAHQFGDVYCKISINVLTWLYSKFVSFSWRAIETLICSCWLGSAISCLLWFVFLPFGCCLHISEFVSIRQLLFLCCFCSSLPTSLFTFASVFLLPLCPASF